jgi:hypothetical protein
MNRPDLRGQYLRRRTPPPPLKAERMGGSGTRCEPLIAALRSEPLKNDRDLGRGGKVICGEET